jgi:hypothetical protein
MDRPNRRTLNLKGERLLYMGVPPPKRTRRTPAQMAAARELERELERDPSPEPELIHPIDYDTDKTEELDYEDSPPNHNKPPLRRTHPRWDSPESSSSISTEDSQMDELEHLLTGNLEMLADLVSHLYHFNGWAQVLAIYHRCRLGNTRHPTVDDLSDKERQILIEIVNQFLATGEHIKSIPTLEEIETLAENHNDAMDEFTPIQLSNTDRIWFLRFSGKNVVQHLESPILLKKKKNGTSLENWTKIRLFLLELYERINEKTPWNCFGYHSLEEFLDGLKARQEIGGSTTSIENWNDVTNIDVEPYRFIVKHIQGLWLNLDCDTFECPPIEKPNAPTLPPPKEGRCFEPYPPLNERFFLYIQSS